MGISTINIIFICNMKKQKVYKICFDNKKLITFLKCININKAFILLMLIFISINIFAKQANNNFDDDTFIITFKIGYINN